MFKRGASPAFPSSCPENPKEIEKNKHLSGGEMTPLFCS